MKIDKFTKTGNYHKETKTDNQDYLCSVETDNFLAIMLADGATACKNGLEGARLACEAMAQVVKKEGNDFFSYPNDKIAFLLTEHILYFLEKNMKNEDKLEEYGSTFSMAFMEKKNGRTVLVNLGDSAIISVIDSKLNFLLNPKQYRGNPCLTTTKGARKAIDVTEFKLRLGDSIMICSDGFYDHLGDKELVSLLESNDINEINKKMSATETMDDCSYILFKRLRE